MSEKSEQVIDDVTRNIVQRCAEWGEDTPPEFSERFEEVRTIIESFLRLYIDEIFCL